MLDGIDEVDWAGLDHAYKGRVYVPDLLRQVASPEAEDAISELYSTIMHQGTIYPATTAAVPWLVDLALHSPYARADVLWLLGDIVDLHQADGPAVRSAIVRELGSLLGLLDDDAADVRAAVAYPLARAGAPAEFLLRRWSVEPDVEVLTSLAFALGELYVPEAGPVLAEAAVQGPPGVTMAAALALTQAGQDWPDGTIPVLVDAIDAEPELPYQWVDGDWAQKLLVPLAAEVAADLFARILRSSRSATRVSALDVIARRCLARRSAPALFIPMAGPALQDPDPDVRWAALDALSQGGAAAGEFADGLVACLAEIDAPRARRQSRYEAQRTLMLLGDPRWVEPACAAAARRQVFRLDRARFTVAALNTVVRRLRDEPARADVLAAVVAQWGAKEAIPELLAGLPYAGTAVTEALLVLGHDDPATLPHLHTLAGRDLPAAAAIWRLTNDPGPVLALLQRELSSAYAVLPEPVALVSTVGTALRPLLPAAEAVLAQTPVGMTHLLAARVVAAAGDWEAAVPTIRAALAAHGPLAEKAAELVVDLAPAHPALASLAPELRRQLHDWYSRVPAARALAQFGFPAAGLVCALVGDLTGRCRYDALTTIVEINAVEAIPDLEKLAEQDERLDATNVVPHRAWADELLRTRITHTIEALRGQSG